MKEIGKIIAAYGFHGDLVIAHNVKNYQTLKKSDSLMIAVWESSFIPFFIKEIKNLNVKELTVKFEEINSREEAIKFINKKVLIWDEKEIITTDENEIENVIGFEIINQYEKKLGLVENIFSSGSQTFIEVNINAKLVLIPFHENLIIKKDYLNKKIQLEIAEGLIEL